MMKKLLLSFVTILFFSVSFGQSPLWRVADAGKVASLAKAERRAMPSEFKLYNLNFEGLKTQLAQAPSIDNGGTSNVVIAFPSVDGTMKNFRIYESAVMHPALAAKFPGNNSYAGQATDNSGETIRFSTTMFGLHVISFSTNGTSYIDTYTKDLNYYIVYDRNAMTQPTSFSCEVVDEESDSNLRSDVQALASDGTFRTYRLAMASTIEYSAFHINAAGAQSGTLAQKKAAVLAAMNVTVTRVNSIYERDMSLRMVLVANNDQIIFVDSDNFDNNNANILIDQSQTVIDGIIGSANYDIGHTVSTGGGGLAQLQAPCGGSKARGITGSPAPVGDPFDIDYVAHEMGHQFGGTHTFNNSCGGNRQASTAVEPGSGTTIMAYAGICPPDIQSNSSPHFHAVSIAQMSAFVAGAGNCSANISNGNAAPVVNAGPNYIIPKGTAFILKGSATDTNGDALTYSWEQLDTEISTQPPVSTATGGPNFVSQIPSTSPNRYMPVFSSVLAGNLQPTWEVVPTVARAMDFSLTVRDNRTPNGGQTGRDNTIITTASVGPFIVTSPAVDNTTWVANTPQTITWDVAGTTANGINTSNVNILFSSDGGSTFTTLVSNTANDGTEVITVPNVSSPYNRILVEAVGNIFYAVSKNIAIGYTITVTTTCTPYTATPNANVSGATNPGFFGYSVTVPDSYIITDANVSVNITHPEPNDLRIGIAIPLSTTVNAFLYDRSCPAISPAQNVVLTFDDEAPVIACGNIGAGNSYKGIDQLSQLDGMNSQGIWRLAVADVTAPNNGVLNSFTFTFCKTETVVQLATQNYSFSEFAVYPNPSNGNFSVRFADATSDDVKILVHDMRGREIYQKQFAGGGIFNQEIQLNTAQSGIYLLSVTNGDRKEVKRIVVE